MADKNLDAYKPLKFYKDKSKPRKNGFAKLKDDGSHYFALYRDGNIALISQSYVNEAGRDNGIESVRKNSKLKMRYHFDTRAGRKHGFALKAGNGQEVAISPNYGSKTKAEYAAGRLNGSVKKTAAALTGASALRGEKAKSPRKDNIEDNYHPLAFYSKHTKGRRNGIETFKGDDGLYYFAHFESGKIRLISEGYPTKTARDTGVASVEKNIKLANRYDYRGPFKNGKFDYRLKAGNGKEIARSVWYGSAATAATGAAYLIGTRKRPVPKGKAKPAAKVVPAAATMVAPIPKPKPKPKTKPKLKPKVKPKAKATPKAKPKPKAKAKPKAAPIVAAAGASAALAAPAMAKAAKPVPPRDKDDDYLKCEDYHGHEVTDAKNNVAFFSHTDNKEYFVVYDDDGDVLIRSEGFDSISKRSSELAAVLRLKNNANYVTRIEKNGYFMDVLKDENGREVGRSCLRKIVPPIAVAPAALAAPIAAKAAVPAATAAGGMGWGWLKWLLPLLLLLLLGLVGLKACGESDDKDAAAAAQAEKAAADKAVAVNKLAAERLLLRKS